MKSRVNRPHRQSTFSGRTNKDAKVTSPKETQTAETESRKWAKKVVSEREAAAAGLLQIPDAVPSRWIEQVKREISLPAGHVDRTVFPVIDRIEFKMAAAKYFLDRLHNMRSEGWWKYKDFDLQLALDCFLVELMGAKDVLLQFMNTFFRLNLYEDEVLLSKINTKLKARRIKSKTIECLNKLSTDNKSWYWKLNDLRNQVTHRGKPEMVSEISGREQKANMYFWNPYDLETWGENPWSKEREVVHYCHEGYERMLELIKTLFRLLGDDMEAELHEFREKGR